MQEEVDKAAEEEGLGLKYEVQSAEYFEEDGGVWSARIVELMK
ncbi:MAG: hypothetical protein PUF10_02935 [Bacteroidales bacterium]|nr:hypothetical protein [Bacteroidales bacterium]